MLLFASLSDAGEIPIYDKGGDTSLALEVRAQLQFFHFGREGGSEDKLFFRRLRPTFEASLGPNWEAEAELDFGETIEGESVELKDLFVAYGSGDGDGATFRALVGNAKAAFSRQYQSSSKRLTLIERGFVGIDDFGTLDRVLGGRVEGSHPSSQLSFVGSFGLSAHKPDSRYLEFESPLNVESDANLGWVLSGRVELSPLGTVGYDQVTFPDRSPRFALGAAAYQWENNGRRNRHSQGLLALVPEKVDLESAQGGELSGAFRGFGFSADAEVQWILGETVDPSFSGGIYRRGATELSKLSLVTGYMLFPDRLELVGGLDRLDATTYQAAWKRIILGLTHYFRQNDLKVQLNYVVHRNFEGVAGDHPQSVVLQLQLLL